MAEYITIKRRVSLDAPIAPESLPGFTYMTEHQAHEFIISVRKNGEKETITGSVSAKVIRPNGTTIFLQGSISDGDAVIRLHQDCYNIPGRLKISIFNTSGGVTTCIYSANCTNDRTTTDTVIDSGDVVPDLSDVVAAQEAAQAATTAANTAAQTANTAAQNVGNIVARAYSASATYKAGDYCTQNGNLYKAKQDISTAEEWTASHWTQIVMGDEVTDLKSALNDISGYTVIHPTEIIEGELVGRDGYTGSSASWNRTPYIEINFADDLGLEITGSFNGIGGCCIYDADKNPIIGIDGNNVADYGGTNMGTLQTITVKPVVGARYIRISVVTVMYSALTDIGVGGYTIAGLVKRVNALEDADTEIEAQITTTNKRFDAVDVSLNSLKDTRLKPYVVETKSRYCWPLNQEPPVFKSSDPRYTEDGNANNAFFKITGNAGDNFVTVVSGGNATPSDISDYTKRWSAVISYDDGVHFEPCLAWYRDANTLGVWPVLKTGITSGELGAMWTDGLHLTRRGYIGFAQAVFNANPKYCAKKTYVAKYVSGDTVPFTEFGGTMYAMTKRQTNYKEDGGFLFANTFDQYVKVNTGTTETTGKRGISWEIERPYPTSGYVEIMLGGAGVYDPDIPAGYEIHVDLYINGVLSRQLSKNTNILETLYFDYADANTLKIEVYQNKQAASAGNGSGFNISCIYFWEGVRNADTLFPKGAVVGQMFDSWGVFHDGASGKEFLRLIDEKAGVTVPFENHSLGSQTSAWGKAWFYENLQKYHPAIGIVDFGINDVNSIPYSLPETVLGPDGKSYNNRIDLTEYISNMQTIADEASNNGIQLICTSCPLTAAGNWYYALADNIG